MKTENIFVKVENPKFVDELVNTMKRDLKLANQQLQEINAIKNRELELVKKWQEKLESVTEKLQETEKNLPQKK